MQQIQQVVYILLYLQFFIRNGKYARI